ncbi:D-alanyl-D-alanine carboxypeptidase [Bacillaceae bacterium Marseille-Q3522]|nr:D-alanyl-D-alanine carboxypeptidase [Bacillaceae bacterium Marseille-Q3522]
MLEVNSLNKVRKSSLSIFVLLFLIASLFIHSPGLVKAEGEDTLGINGEAAILIDAETGEILYEKNADQLLGVASMSKMMTEYLVMEAIKEGKISWDQNVTINEYVHRLSAAPGLSNVGLTQGEEYTVKELYEAMAIFSGNAAAVALAETVAGTEQSFVEMMNQKAGELGLVDYKFVNSTGLNNDSLLGNIAAGGANDENVMSARATAKLAYHLLKDHPEILETSGVSELHFKDGRVYKNFNFMLPGLIYEYQGMDGLKTGSTDFAGYCFTATAERDGKRFISVIMKTASKDERFAETRKLLDFAFNNFSKKEVLPSGYTVEENESLPVVKGKNDKVNIETSKAVQLMIRNGEEEQYKAVLVLDEEKLNDQGELTAPVKKGDKVGTITIEKNGEPVSFLTDDGQTLAQVDVVATENVEKANWFVLMMRGIGSFFSDLWGNISDTVAGWF